jgi:hypothetical protein
VDDEGNAVVVKEAELVAQCDNDVGSQPAARVSHKEPDL